MMCGVDEAGLGAKVGSLFVVGVEVSGDMSNVRESKETFRRSLSSYAKAESLVLSALRDLNLYSESVQEAWERIFGTSQDIYAGLNFPLFGDGMVENLPFRLHRIRPLEVPACKLKRNRFFEDAKALVEIALDLRCSKVVCGLAGGFRFYALEGWTREETEEGVIYSKGGKTILFSKKADRRFKEVALASIFAKYFREVHMLAINRLVGFKGEIPWASGYPSDPKTHHLIKALKEKSLEEFLRIAS